MPFSHFEKVELSVPGKAATLVVKALLPIGQTEFGAPGVVTHWRDVAGLSHLLNTIEQLQTNGEESASSGLTGVGVLGHS